MRAQVLVGARRGRRIRTKIPGPQARAADLVRRRFNPPPPDQLWVADFNYVPIWSGMVHVALHWRWAAAADAESMS
jgi:putative transposase